ncbi:hypothetical protein B0H19DRAFT_289404 [Mycena capillaripes]|nr:hypothetical protein B0H19DRAFT_289404 [Mycena capillaripes]
MQVPVEVKSDWNKMIAQAGTYARSLFSAIPSRTFALVLAVNHKEKNLRLLIFHRSGLTVNSPFQLDNQYGQTAALRLIMTLLLWSEPYHAGFPSTSNNLHHLIPIDDTQFIRATVTKVIHRSTCVRGRATRVCRLLCSEPSSAASTSDPTPLPDGSATEATVTRRSPRFQKPLDGTA